MASPTSSVVAVIPARMGSSRFPGKPIAPLLRVELLLREDSTAVQALAPPWSLPATLIEMGTCAAMGAAAACAAAFSRGDRALVREMVANTPLEAGLVAKM